MNRFSKNRVKNTNSGIPDYVLKAIQETNNMRKKANDSLIERVTTNDPTLKRIHIGNFTDEQLQALAKALQTNSSLQKLDWSYAEKFGWEIDKRIIYLKEALKSNTTLLELNLSNNKIKDTGIAHIAEIIQANTGLLKIDISCNAISDAGFLVLEKALSLNTTLTDCRFLDHRIVNSEMAKRIATMMGYKACGIYAKKLKQNDISLTKLELDKRFINDKGIQLLAEGIQYTTVLKELNLSFNEISSAGINCLAAAIKNSRLKILKLLSNKIDDEGINCLVDALQTNTHLEEIGLEANLITDKGAEKIAQLLQVNRSLKEIHLIRNQITDAGALMIFKAIKNNLIIENVESDKDETVIDIRHRPQINPSLSSIILVHFDYYDRYAIQIARTSQIHFTALCSIKLSGNQLTNAGKQAIIEMLKMNTTNIDCKANLTLNYTKGQNNFFLPQETKPSISLSQEPVKVIDKFYKHYQHLAVIKKNFCWGSKFQFFGDTSESTLPSFPTDVVVKCDSKLAL